LRDPLLALGLGPPEGDRVAILEVAGGIDEVLPLGQRHPRLLRCGVARERGAAPAHLALRLALEEALEELAGGRRADRLAVGIDPARVSVVALPPDAERAGRRFDLDAVELRDRAQLLVARVGQ